MRHSARKFLAPVLGVSVLLLLFIAGALAVRFGREPWFQTGLEVTRSYGLVLLALVYAATFAVQRFLRRDVLDGVLGGGGMTVVALVSFGAVASLASARYTGSDWIDFVFAGLTQGSIYALIALGYTLVYGILRMINFAHGEVFTGGAMTTYFLATAFAARGWLERFPIPSILLLVLFSAVVSMTIAILLERIAYRPLRGAPRLIPLITAIGASFFLQYTFRGLYGSGINAYPNIDITVFGKEVSNESIVIVSALLLMLALFAFVQLTKTGMAMRAVAEDREAAALMGIDVDRVIVTTFAIGGALAGAAGVLYSLVFRQTQFFMGFIPGLKAFTAAVLGGIGNIPGAMLGGLFLGIIESVGPFLFLEGLGVPSPNQLKDAIAFTMLVLVLIFRPTGILGERVVKRA